MRFVDVHIGYQEAGKLPYFEITVNSDRTGIDQILNTHTIRAKLDLGYSRNRWLTASVLPLSPEFKIRRFAHSMDSFRTNYKTNLSAISIFRPEFNICMKHDGRTENITELARSSFVSQFNLLLQMRFNYK